MNKKIFLCAMSILCIALPYEKINAQNTNECKIWKEYSLSYKNQKSTILPNFSYAGYHNAEIPVPEVNYKVFNVCDYGAVANDQFSDRTAVLKAIASAEKNGSGIIYFPKGRYLLHEKDEENAPIIINSSRIVFKGDGAGCNGTEIFMDKPLRAPNPDEKWTSPSLLSFTGRAFAPVITDVTANSMVGSFSVKVKETKGLKVGEFIALRLSNNSRRVIDKELAPYPLEDDWTNLIVDGVQIADYHKIVSIKKDIVTFKEPLMRNIDVEDEWFIQSFPNIEEVGVEDIAFVGNWKEKFVHHKDDIHDGGWKFLEFKNVTNSWIRRCRFTDMSELASITSSANVSVYDCIITGNTGHNAVHSQGSTRVFLGCIKDAPSQWHSVGVCKPSYSTVVWRVHTDGNSCFESHASQPRFTLFDACCGAFMQGRAGGAIPNNPNHLDGLVLWNYKELDNGSKNFKFWADNTRYFRFMPPIIVGFHGQNTTFDESQVKYIESLGKKVNPESLYEEQLKLRLGKVPQWLLDLKEIVKNESYAGNLPKENKVNVKNTDELSMAVANYKYGDIIILCDGNYSDAKLIVNKSGSFTTPFVIKALHPGKAKFTGDVKIELRGNHIVFDGFSFVDGARDAKEWKSHGPGLVAIYGDYVEIKNCLFKDFDKANSAYITTSLDKNGRVPQYADINHCAFIGKSTLDQVINLNNTFKKELTGKPGIPMYHKVSNCFFSNPKKKGNAGGAIRIGYWRKDMGRCFIFNNLFERQDSEAEIITSKSQENVIYNNTFMNCQGTMNLRHGDHQVLLNNFFIGTDKKHEYGGAFIWGSNNLIACNFFLLPTTLASRGNSALYLNCGPKDSEHAVAYNNAIINNTFISTAGTEINLAGMYERRLKEFGKDKALLPFGNKFIGNRFFCERAKQQPIVANEADAADNQIWIDNVYNGMPTGLSHDIKGLRKEEMATLRYDDSKIYVEDIKPTSLEIIKENMPYTHIEGINLDFEQAVEYGVCNNATNRRAVGPNWCIGLLKCYDEK